MVTYSPKTFPEANGLNPPVEAPSIFHINSSNNAVGRRGGVTILEPCAGGEWRVLIDFTQSQSTVTTLTGCSVSLGVYENGSGWRHNDDGAGCANRRRRIQVRMNVSGAGAIKRIRATYNYALGTIYNVVNNQSYVMQDLAIYTSGLSLLQRTSIPYSNSAYRNGNGLYLDVIPTEANQSNVGYWYFTAVTSDDYTSPYSYNGSAYLTGLTICGTGTNPFV